MKIDKVFISGDKNNRRFTPFTFGDIHMLLYNRFENNRSFIFCELEIVKNVYLFIYLFI